MVKMINIRKRGSKYQYVFEAGKVNGKRKQITKCGFKTKRQALIVGEKAYMKFINGGIKEETNMSYVDYLDYWVKEYYEINFKYSTAKRYKETFGVIKNELGIENCRFYDLRGSFATRSLRSGVEIKDVVNNLGHKRIETIENLKNVTETFEKNFRILDDGIYFHKEK